VNEVICHGIPDDRPFADGDLVNLDVSIYTSDGFHSDLNETYIVGSKTNEKGRKLVQCAYECLRVAVSACKPGVMYRDLGTLITRTAGAYGFSVVTSFCGHGVGRLFHGAPNVPHYAKNKAVGYMKAGHVFTIEPMINEGGPGDEMWPDDWTAVTRDGKRSAQFEHSLLITETGVEVLSARVGTDRSCMPAWAEADVLRPLPGLPASAPAASSAEGAAAAAKAAACSSSAAAAAEAASVAGAAAGAGGAGSGVSEATGAAAVPSE
jgi:methionyl aminopeptidase